MPTPSDTPQVAKDRALARLVPLGPVNSTASQVVAANLLALMALPTDIQAMQPIPEAAYMPTRRQYDAVRIIEALAAGQPSAPVSLGLTAVDLGTPILTYVFGESQLGGCIALVSLYRLGGVSEERTLQRLAKVSLHEIGHVLGLGHCWKPHCLMRSPRNTDHLDEMELDFCDSCSFEISRRVHQLAAH